MKRKKYLNKTEQKSQDDVMDKKIKVPNKSKKKKPVNFMPPKGTPECKNFISNTTKLLLEGFIKSIKNKEFPYITNTTVLCMNNDRYEGIRALEKIREITNKYNIIVSKYNSWQHGGRAIAINIAAFLTNTTNRVPISMDMFFTHHEKWSLRSISMVTF